MYCLCVNKNKVCNVAISGDYKYKILQTISRECVMYADIVDKEQVFMEHILLPGDAARIR